jgi:hypothetical protein
MKSSMKTIFPAACILIGLSACAPPTRFVWGNYEQRLYSSYADAGETPALLAELAKTTAQGDALGKTAPGLHAEYGYLLMGAGRPQDAVDQFQKERQAFPESKLLMEKMIEMATSGKSVKPAQAPAPASVKVGS